MLFELDRDGRIVFAAGALEAFSGLLTAEVVGKCLIDLVQRPDQAALTGFLARARQRQRVEDTSIRLQGKHGLSAPLCITGYQLPELEEHFFLGLRNRSSGRPPQVSCELRRDEVSGLQVRDDFVRSIGEAMAESGDKANSSLSLIVLPGFEQLQQRLADHTEKQMLSMIGACLRANSLTGDAASRLGNDRFGVMHSEDLNIEQLTSDIAEITRDLDPLNRGVSAEAQTLSIPGAGGDDGKIARGLGFAISRFASADEDSGTLTGDLSQLANEALNAARTLKSFIERGEFSMVLQPIIDAKSGVIHHYEALARFPESSTLGTPYQHISLAEFTGIIIDFDLAMAKKAIDWLRKEIGEGSRLRVAINVSGQSINSSPYLANLDQLLKRNSWLNGRLMFEITESARIADLAAANAFVQRLRRQGAEVCLDDFGAGAANFQYLSGLEVDVIKLDGQALRDARKAEKGKAFLRAFIRLCRELGVKTVAEMIDSEPMLAFVRECGVDYVQGYLFGRPSPDVRDFSQARGKDLFERGA